MAPRKLGILFPLGGLHQRTGYQTQPPWTTPDCLNVFPDGQQTQRERGGSRYGHGKAFAQQIGDGAPVRLLDTVSYIDNGAALTRVVASAGGEWWYQSDPTTLTKLNTSITLASDRELAGGMFDQRYFIADNGPVVVSGDDGDFSGEADEMTSATVSDWQTAGVDPEIHALVIEEHDPINDVQTITFNGTPTGGAWRIYDPLWNDGASTTLLTYDISTTDLQLALEEVYGAGNVSVTGTASVNYVIEFIGDLAGREMATLQVDDTTLADATIDQEAAHTTVGASSIRYAGHYEIDSLATGTLTLKHPLRKGLTGVVFRVERCPKYWDPRAGELRRWFADLDANGESKGFVPIGRNIFCVWRGRAVMAGGDPSIDFSRVNDFFDWDYSQEDVSAATSLVASEIGIIGEHLRACIPHNDSCLIIGCTTSLWVLRGDPAGGGSLELLDETIGIVDKFAWCKSPEGYLWFLSHDGLYMMTSECGSRPKSVSRERIPEALLSVDTSVYAVALGYCQRYRILEVYVTHRTTGQTVHYWIDVRQYLTGDQTGASFFPIKLADADYEPFVVHAHRDASGELYSTLLLGCRDGYIRRAQHNLKQDDGKDYESYVDLGPVPVVKDGFSDGMLKEIVPILGVDSGPVRCEIRVGNSVEAAYKASPAATFDWSTGGRSRPSHVRLRGPNLFLRLSHDAEDSSWEMERIDIIVDSRGRLR